MNTKDKTQNEGLSEPLQQCNVVGSLDFYKLPFKRSIPENRVRDKNGNFVFQFEPKFEKGNFREGFLELIDKVLDSINSKKHEPIKELDLKISDIIPIEIFNGNEHFITIRGWGNLTGTGAKNFSAEKASAIQDDFRD